MELKATFSICNNKMRSRRRAMGITQISLAKRFGVDSTLISRIELLDFRYGTRYTEEIFHDIINKISAILGLDREEIMPAGFAGINCRAKKTTIKEVEANALLAYAQNREHVFYLPSPALALEEKLDAEDTRKAIAEILHTLTFREREILRMRFGLDGKPTLTLQGISSILKITPERVRQVERKALWKLQIPKRADKLMKYVQWPIEEGESTK